MGKQSMGTPTHTWHLQSETKLYRLQTPAAPLFRTSHYDSVGMDNNAMGVNAVVAVISYTGYDMEDAMILNKSSYERGLAHGSIYKSEFLELTPVSNKISIKSLRFHGITLIFRIATLPGILPNLNL
jgi:DNA-directed RNA polymerase I subunit RPA2